MRDNTDWVAIARSLGHTKYVAKELAYAFKDDTTWWLLYDRKFKWFFANVIEIELNTCGAGCCQSQRVVGPNGWVEFSLGKFDDGWHWRIVEGRLEEVPALKLPRLTFENYPTWLACYRRRRKLIRASQRLKKA